MKNIKLIITVFSLVFFIGCSNQDDIPNVDAISAPANISALMTIKQDNSGKVTILPKGEGVSQFEIYFGDGTTEPAYVSPGSTTQHTYAEGTFNVKIVGVSLNGKKTEAIQSLTVSFLPPTNLNVTITPGASLSVAVSATADLETFFQVYFGDSPSEIPVDFMEGETVTHTYALAGTYPIRVVALSGGVATTESIQNVTINQLICCSNSNFTSG